MIKEEPSPDFEDFEALTKYWLAQLIGRITALETAFKRLGIDLEEAQA